MKWITLLFLLIFFFISYNSFASSLPDFRYTYIYDYERMDNSRLNSHFCDDIKRKPGIWNAKPFFASSIPKPPLILFFASGLIGIYLTGQKFRK